MITCPQWASLKRTSDAMSFMMMRPASTSTLLPVVNLSNRSLFWAKMKTSSAPVSSNSCKIDHHLTQNQRARIGSITIPSFAIQKIPPQKPIIAIPKPKKLSRNEAMMEKYKGELSPKSVVQEALEALLVDKPSTTDFVMQLAANNIKALPNIASTGKMNGFSFEYPGHCFRKASQLGKGSGRLQKQAKLPSRNTTMLSCCIENAPE